MWAREAPALGFLRRVSPHGPMDTAPLLEELALDPEFFAQMTLNPLTLAMQALPSAALHP